MLKKEAKIIIMSHIGRPKGEVVKGMSLKPISEKLSLLLNKKVFFNENLISENTLLEINKIPNGSILMLENIRFNEGEETNDCNFSKKITASFHYKYVMKNLHNSIGCNPLAMGNWLGYRDSNPNIQNQNLTSYR